MIDKLKNALRHFRQTVFGRDELEDDLSEEIRLHIEELAEDYERQGMSRQEAYKAARIRFGGTERIREECRDSWTVRMVSSFWRDTQLGIRQLVKSMGFTSTVLVTLALGIGASISIFSFVNAYLLTPLPYPNEARLATITPANNSFGRMSVAYANFRDWQEMNETFDAIEAARYSGYNLTGIENPERLDAVQVSGGFLPMLGAQALLGRLFGPEESQMQAAPTAVITYQFWERFFNSDPEAVGKTMLLNGELFTIIGVTNEEFQYPPGDNTVEIWTPLELMENSENFVNRAFHEGTSAIGTIKEGTSLEQAQADMTRIATQLKSEYADSNADDNVFVDNLRERVYRFHRPGIIALMAAVGCVLLIVCVNVAGLLTARAASRKREISFRVALGARRWDILRQLLSENLILTFLGGAGGLAISFWGTRFLYSAMGDQVNLLQIPPVLLDRNMFLFFVGLIFVVSFLFSLFPYFQSAPSDTKTALDGGTRTASSGKRHQVIRQVLVVLEIAMAVIILSGAGLLIRSYQNYVNSDPGYDPSGVLTLRAALPEGAYDSNQKKINFYNEFIEKSKQVPGIQFIGMSSGLMGGSQTTYVVEGRPPSDAQKARYTERASITSEFTQAMGIPLVAGRLFDERDTQNSLPVAIVDERFVQQAWPDENPIGKRFQYGSSINPDGTWLEVVGVVSHMKHYGVDRESRESTYRPANQGTFDRPNIVIRCEGDPLQLIEPIRKIIGEIDPNIAPSGIRTLQAIADDQSYGRRMITTTLSVFAITALLLAALGIYGVTAYSVNQRKQEFGIRIALGGRRSNIIKIVLANGAKLTLIGLAIGLITSLSLSSLLRSMVFGVSTFDPATFAMTTVILCACILAACYLPARRAATSDPMKALREE